MDSGPSAGTGHLAYQLYDRCESRLWRKPCQQAIDELPDEAGAVTAPDHVRYADKLVDATRVGWMRAESLIPGAERIALDITERLIIQRDNELIHIGVIEVAAHQSILFVGLSPPAHDFRRLEPAPDRREVTGRHRTEDVSRRHRSAALQHLDGHVAIGIDTDVGGDIERPPHNRLGVLVRIDQRAGSR